MSACGARQRLLLGETVKSPQSPDEIDAVDADDLTISRTFCEDAERFAIAPVVEGRHEQDTITHVEVGVARWKAHAVHHHGPREGKTDHAKVAVCSRFEPPQIVRG